MWPGTDLPGPGNDTRIITSLESCDPDLVLVCQVLVVMILGQSLVVAVAALATLLVYTRPNDTLPPHVKAQNGFLFPALLFSGDKQGKWGVSALPAALHYPAQHIVIGSAPSRSSPSSAFLSSFVLLLSFFPLFLLEVSEGSGATMDSAVGGGGGDEMVRGSTIRRMNGGVTAVMVVVVVTR